MKQHVENFLGTSLKPILKKLMSGKYIRYLQQT